MLAVALVSLLLPSSSTPARAESVPDEHESVIRVPQPADPHWPGVADRPCRHSTLFNGDHGRALGMVGVFVRKNETGAVGGLRFTAGARLRDIEEPGFSAGAMALP